MRKWLIPCKALAVLAVTMMFTGCSPKSEPERPQVSPKPVPEGNGSVAPEAKPPMEPIPIEVPAVLGDLEPEATSIPEVTLSAAHRATCKVLVGDPFPDGELATIDGGRMSIGALRGEAATVVFFWRAGETEIARKTAQSALADLQADVVSVYGGRGVNVVAINHRDPAAVVAEVLEQVDIQFPVLLDGDGSYFAQVATERLPRIYVIDGQGEIAWFDLEYSEATRQMLKRTLQAMLGD